MRRQISNYEFRARDVIAGLIVDVVAVVLISTGIGFAARFFLRAVGWWRLAAWIWDLGA